MDAEFQVCKMKKKIWILLLQYERIGGPRLMGSHMLLKPLHTENIVSRNALNTYSLLHHSIGAQCSCFGHLSPCG